MSEKITLPNGVRIVWEKVPHVRSAAVGIWVGVGSRYERRSEGGAAHFIEHMLFKGTSRYSAGDLAGIMDAIGGQINAYTTRDSTCFYARVLDTHLDTAIDLLGDMFFDSRFDQSDVESERGVIFEEMDMYADTPDDLVTERLLARTLPGALGRPVLGTKKTLGAFTGDSLRAFKERMYTAPRIVVALCGHFTTAHIRRLRRIFAALPAAEASPPAPAHYAPAFIVRRKATEQNQLCLGFPGLPMGHEDRFALQLLSTILGGSMSSRLFQTVRERNGLCYGIYTFTAGFSDVGLFGVSTALGRETEDRALELIMEELRRLRNEGVTAEELSRAREQTKSNLVISMESTTARMNKLGVGELMLGYSLAPDEVIARYDAVTEAQILSVARQVLDFSRLSFSAVGRVRPAEAYQEALGKLGTQN